MKKALLLLLAISTAPYTQTFANPQGPIVIAGPGNPAAILCDTLKGRLVPVEFESGRSTLCAFGSAMIEQWTLFRVVKNRTPQQATEALLNNSTCSLQGATLLTGQREDNGADVVVCEFSDGSIIEQQTLENGNQSQGHQKLLDLISR